MQEQITYLIILADNFCPFSLKHFVVGAVIRIASSGSSNANPCNVSMEHTFTSLHRD